MPLATARALAALLIAFSLTAAPSAQTMHPDTGEPVPLGISAPPAADAPPAARSGDALIPIVHLTAGSTKLVRIAQSGPLGGIVVYEDGADLLVGSIAIPVDRDGGDPVFVEDGRVTLPGLPTDAVFSDDRLLVSLGKAPGLIEFDLSGLYDSDPDTGIEEVQRADYPSAFAVAVSEDRVYVGRGTAGVAIHARDGLSLLGSFDTPGSANGLALTVFDFGVPGLVVADGNVSSGHDVRIYEVTDPSAPLLLASSETNGFATYAAMLNDQVVLVTGTAGLTAISVADGSVLSTVGADGTTYEVVINQSEERAYVNGLGGARVIDVSDPENLAVLAANDFGGQGLSIATFVTTTGATAGVLAADRFGGLRMLRASDLDEEARFPNGGFSHKPVFDVATERLFVTDLAGRLRTFRVRADGPPAEEILDARTDVPSNTQQVLVDGGVAYVTHASGVTILDVSGEGPYPVLGQIPQGQSFGMALRDDVLYVAAGFAGVQTFDATDRAVPFVLSETAIGANVVDVTLDNDADVAYVVSFGGGMLSYDVSTPASPVQLDAEPNFGFLNAVAQDRSGLADPGIVYVADGQAGLRVVDASDPADLASIATSPTSTQARDVDVARALGGDFPYLAIYVADDFYGVREFSAFSGSTGDPTRDYASADRGIGVATTNYESGQNHVALAAGEAGVYIFEAPFSVAGEPGAGGADLTVGVFPNPARGAATLSVTLTVGADVEVSVYDALGRRVATRAQTLGAGAQTIGLDTSGWAPGVYVARVQAGGGVATARLTVVR